MAEIPFTEPTPIACIFISGAACEFPMGFVRIVAWEERPPFPGSPIVRQIIGRWVLPDTAARALLRDLQRGLRKGGN